VISIPILFIALPQSGQAHYFSGTEQTTLSRGMKRLFWIDRAENQRADRLRLDLAARRELRARIRARRSAVVVRKLNQTGNTLAQSAATLPRGQFGKALGYLECQRAALEIFLTEPRIPLTNYDSERDLRHIVLGRNNWFVFASPRGGEVACRLYSLVFSCKGKGIDPQVFIEDVLTRISTTPANRIAGLTPWGWAAARAAEAAPLAS
jgi:transposase